MMRSLGRPIARGGTGGTAVTDEPVHAFDS
jgi:hypothetical protein